GKVLLLSHGDRCQLGRTPIRERQPDPAALGTAVNAVQGLRRNDPPEILSPRGHPDPDRSRRLRLRGRYIRLPPRHCPDAARATDARDRIWMLAAAGPDVAAITPKVNAFRAAHLRLRLSKKVQLTGELCKPCSWRLRWFV